eukprot:TRINITY_DN16599_c0_g1_i1.p1 TRINITY_DN16599_c0_g1~~TRINITY_DN16599_c0_g1_i1.p1  ORF type:complete len:122 (+),score=11.68 TRINITY_DN16599_c0_g1_i1:72-437(+)
MRRSGGIARITEIYQDRDKALPQLDLIWFWRASQLENDRYDDDEIETEQATEHDIAAHELHLDDTYPDDIPINAMIEGYDDRKSSKVLLVPSIEEYLKAIKNEQYFDEYKDIFGVRIVIII